MKKLKQILAILLIVILIGLYIASLILALIGSENAMAWLKISIYASIVLPVLIWAFTFITKLIKGSDEELNDK